MRRTMGLDVGERTIGVAFSDLLGITAQGHGVWRRRTLKEDLDYLNDLADEYEVADVVIGLPRRTDGTFGPESASVKEFGRQVAEAIGIPVVYYDERFTTKIAEQALISQDVRRSKRKQVIDKVAAMLILQGYLDRHGPK